MKKLPVNETEVKLRRSVDAVLRTEHGRALWAHLVVKCGFFETSLTRTSNGEVAPLSTECKEAQRLLYLNLRKLASPELRAVAETLAEVSVPITTPEEDAKERK